MVAQSREGTMTSTFLVDSCGALFMVRVIRERSWSWPFQRAVATGFKVFKAYLERSRWSRMTTIGSDQVLFLSRHQCRPFSVSQLGVPEDSIFFFEGEEDENVSWHGIASSPSCSVYDMKDGTVSCPLSRVWWKRAAVHATWLFPED